jgi:dynein heavy chain
MKKALALPDILPSPAPVSNTVATKSTSILNLAHRAATPTGAATNETEDTHIQKRVRIDQEEILLPAGLELNQIEIDFDVLSTAAAVSERFRSAARMANDPFTFILALEKRRVSVVSSQIPVEMEFAYLNPVRKDSPTFNPYHLEIVDNDKIDKNDFYTISRKGVTHFLNGVADFTPLQQWIREYHLFNHIITIPFFEKYRLWKCYTVWRKNVRASKIQHNRKMLTKNLFLLDQVLCRAILDMRKICLSIYSWRLGNVDSHVTYNLSEYDKQQKEWVSDTIKPTLTEFESVMRATVETACQMSLKKAGFDMADQSGASAESEKEEEAMEPILDVTTVNEDMFGASPPPKKLSFTQQAARRTECRRLQRFVKLADYMIISTLHFMMVNSIKDLLYFVYRNCTDDDVILNAEEKDHIFAAVPTLILVDKGLTAFASRTVALTASDTLIQNTPSENPNTQGDNKLAPLFRAELLMTMENNALYFDPDIPDFLITVETLLKQYVNVIESVHLLTGSIPYLEQNDRFEEQEHGEGPNIATIIQEGFYFQALIIRLRGTLSGNFNNARKFAETFKAFQDMFNENAHIDFSLLALPPELASQRPRIEGFVYPDPTLDFFEHAMAKYSQQKQLMLQIATASKINNLLIDTAKLKELLLPSPQRCFNEIAKVLPGLARDKNEALLTDLNHSLRIFTSPVQNVEAFVEYLDHLHSGKLIFV